MTILSRTAIGGRGNMADAEITPGDALAGIADPHEREIAAEKLFFDTAPAHFPLGFSIYHRNPGHWDVYARQVPGKASAWLAAHPGGYTSAIDRTVERAFRIRGEPGAVTVFDERWNPHRPHPRESLTFASVASAVAWIADELMAEPVGSPA